MKTEKILEIALIDVELIAAAEAVIYGWEKTMHKGPDQTADAIYRMRCVLERIKNDD